MAGRTMPRRLGWPVAGLVAVLALTTARFALLTWHAARFPYELDYGEGIVWQQVRMITAGMGYAPLAPYPAIVFHYPPVFHLLAASVMATGVDGLLAGRLVALASTLVGLAFAGLVAVALAREEAEARRLGWGGLVAAASLLATEPVIVWAQIMRVDMPFVALSFAGLWLGMKALDRPRLVHGAALCFAGAIFAKQTAIAAPLAVFSVLLVARPKTALAGIGTGLAVALAALSGLEWATHGEFLYHVVFYNMNRFSSRGATDIPLTIASHGGLVLAAIAAMAPRARALVAGGRLTRLQTDPQAARTGMVLLHMALATAMLALVFKSGSAVNYYLEWIWLMAIGAGVAFADYLGWADGARRGWWHWLVPAAIGLQALGSWLLIEDDYGKRAANRVDFDRMAAAMRAAPGPVLSDDMVLVLRAGKPVVLEPAVFAELTARHQLDDRPVLARLARHAFSMVVTEGWPGDPVFDSRYTPAMARAITANYPHEIQLAKWYIVRLPAGPLPAWAEKLDR